MNLTNFRDLGGIQVKNGAHIKTKRILRSGELFKMEEEDREILSKDYALRVILDLRSANETLPNPDDEIAGARYVNLDVMRDLPEDNASFENLKHCTDVSMVDAHMEAVYKNLILNKASCIEYNRLVTEIAENKEGSCLFHCFAGKDRTGIAAAIILEILGASRDDIFEDYLLTNIQRAAANRLLCQAAESEGLSGIPLLALERLLLVKADYLHQAYTTIAEAYGSFDRYLTDGLLITSEMIEQLKVQYLL